MSLLIRSVLLVASIPVLALAIEPTNPTTLCERFLTEPDIADCKHRTEKDSVDWYAASVCNQQKDHKAFWQCWNSVTGKHVNPQALNLCANNEDLSDLQRQACIEKTLSERKPAAASVNGHDSFQPLRFKHSR